MNKLTLFVFASLAAVVAQAADVNVISVKTGEVGWQFPVANEGTIDGFRLYIDGKADYVKSPSERGMYMKNTGISLGQHTLVVRAFKGGVESAPSNELVVNVVDETTTVPPAGITPPTDFVIKISVGVTVPPGVAAPK